MAVARTRAASSPPAERWRQESSPARSSRAGSRRGEGPRPAHPRPRLRHRPGDALLRPARSLPRGLHRGVDDARPDVIVVGAGIVGRGVRRGARRGGLPRTVLERAFAGAGATGAAMGHLVVMDDSEAQFALTSLSRRLWTERAPDAAPELEDDPCGTLWVAADEEEMAHVRKKAAFYAARGVEVEVLAAEALRDGRAAACGRASRAPCACPATASLYPPAAARFFLERARASGAPSVETERSGRGARPRRRAAAGGGSRPTSSSTPPGPRRRASTPGLPIVPRKGHLVITDRYPGFCRHQVVELGYLKSAHALTPRVGRVQRPAAPDRPAAGRLVARARGLGRRRSTAALRARMLRRAAEFMPGARAARRRCAPGSGFRPATPDKLPLVGMWEPGLWVAAGHEGLGVTTAPGTARAPRRPRPRPDAADRSGAVRSPPRRCPPMTERVRFTVDGRPAEARSRTSLARRALERGPARRCARP